MILSPNGRVPSVVHQYDRPQKDLLQIVNRVYRVKEFKFDGRFTDIKSAFDQTYHLLDVENWEMLMKVFVNYLVDKMDFSISYRTDYFVGWGNYLVEIWQKVLQKNKALTSEIELLEIVLQRCIIVAHSKGIKLWQLNHIYSLTNYCIANNRTISTPFKNFVANGLFNFAKIFFKNGNYLQSKAYIDAIKNINVPMNENFYNFQLQVYEKLKIR